MFRYLFRMRETGVIESPSHSFRPFRKNVVKRSSVGRPYGVREFSPFLPSSQNHNCSSPLPNCCLLERKSGEEGVWESE